MSKKEELICKEISMLKFTLNSLVECVNLTQTEISIAHEQLDRLEKSIINPSE